MHDLSAADLERCRRGGPAAMEVVFREYGDDILRLSLGLLGREEDAEDASQEVLLRVADKARTFRGRSLFGTWVYRLAVNHCLNRRRRREDEGSRTSPLPESATDELSWTGPGPDEEAERDERRRRLWEWLGRLDERSRAVLVLRELHELSYREIGQVLDVPIGTVMSRLSRARARFLEVARGPCEETRAARSREEARCDVSDL